MRLLLIIILGVSFVSSLASAKIETFVMGPLEQITDWNMFKKRLEILKGAGVEGITTDIVWGLVEPREGEFHWDYYKKYASVVRESGLKVWSPIIAFQEFGHTVGDTTNYEIPQWVWSKYPDMHFVSASGYKSPEYISYWTNGAYRLYVRVMESFAKNFSEDKDIINKIYLGVGPAGELRYPSYYVPAGWNYPDIGELQAYSDSAKRDFRFFLGEYYKTIDQLNRDWNSHFSSFNDEAISPPKDSLEFFRNGRNTNYGRIFLRWYQSVLERHLESMIAIARENLAPTFSVPFNIKIAGVHWKIGDPMYSRSAELAAGYVDYPSLLAAFARNRVELTYTSVGVPDNNTFPAFSLPRYLLNTISEDARKHGVPWHGENAMSLAGQDSYRSLRRILFETGAASFNLLRMTNLFDNKHDVSIKYLRDLITGAKRHYFLVKTPEFSKGYLQSKNVEVRIVGNVPSLGAGDPSKGLVLHEDISGSWSGEGDFEEPEAVQYKALLYDIKSGKVIAETLPERLIHENEEPETIFARFSSEDLTKMDTLNQSCFKQMRLLTRGHKEQ